MSHAEASFCLFAGNSVSLVGEKLISVIQLKKKKKLGYCTDMQVMYEVLISVTYLNVMAVFRTRPVIKKFYALAYKTRLENKCFPLLTHIFMRES